MLNLPKYMATHIPLIILIVVIIFGSIVIFSILGITFDSHKVSVLKRAAIIENT